MKPNILTLIKENKRILFLLSLFMITVALNAVIVLNLLEIGRVINNTFGLCMDDSIRSFPCYGIYPIYLAMCVFALGLVFLGRIAFILMHRNDVIQKTRAQSCIHTILYAFYIWWAMLGLWIVFASLFIR